MNTATKYLVLLFILLIFSTSSDATVKSKSIYSSKSVWHTQDGKKTALRENLGHPVVAAMIYTSCPGACPLMMADLKKIESGLSEEAKKIVRFAVFTFDSKNDSTKSLKAFAEKHGVDQTRWTFYHGAPVSVRELAALLGVRFKIIADGEIDHSNSITILDPEGAIVHQQLGLRQKPDASIEALEKFSAPTTP